MGTVVESIFDALKSEVSTELGASFKELRRRYDLENNDLRSAKSGFAVRHGAAISTEGVIREYTMDHTFEVVLTKTVLDRINDENISEALNVLYDNIDDIIRRLFLRKLGIPLIVLNVSNPSISEPELLSGNEIVVLTLSIDIKYRNAIT